MKINEDYPFLACRFADCNKDCSNCRIARIGTSLEHLETAIEEIERAERNAIHDFSDDDLQRLMKAKDLLETIRDYYENKEYIREAW